MTFSIIIPAFNEKKRLLSFMSDLVEEISNSGLKGEIILVDDGSKEEDYNSYLAATESLKQKIPVKIIRHLKNKGKGASIKTGFKEASGEWVGFVDADGSTPTKETMRIFRIVLSSEVLDGVFGVRIRMLGYDICRKLIRHLSGRCFVTLAHILLGVPYYDPQCGCKFFRRSKIMPFLGICKEDRYALDVELVSLGYLKGLKFLEVPISWHDISGSKVSVIKDGFSMAISIFRIRRRFKKMGII